MKVKEERKNYLKHALMGTSAFALLATAGINPAFAQDADDADEVEEVIVTGSRIKRAGFDTLQPASTVDSEFMDDRGFTNVAEAINEIPAFGLPTSNQGGQAGNTTGQNFVNAFGLGTQRTLTLINGRRTVGQNTPAIGAGLQVDLNIIPTGLIDRVETIYTGGAPIYGSDAIAGTVNIILKKDYEGMNLDAQYGVTQKGDGQTYRLRSLMGGNFGDGRGNATIALEWSKVDSVLGTARREYAEGWGWCNSSGPTTYELCYDSSTVWQVPNTGMPLTANNLSFAFAGANVNNLVDGDGDALVYDTNGKLIKIGDSGAGNLYHVFFSSGANSVDNDIYTGLGETNTLISPVERFIINANGHYEITEGTRFFVESMYARSEAWDKANQPVWSTAVFGPGAGGLLAIDLNDNPYVSAETLGYATANGIYDALLDDGDPTTTADNQLMYLTRSNIDILEGSENFRDQDVFRIVAGLEGEVEMFGNPFNWDVAYTFGQTNSMRRFKTLNGNRFAYAVDAVVDPDSGDIVCRSQLDPQSTQGGGVADPIISPDITNCVPFNPFGFGGATDAVKEYMLHEAINGGQIQQSVVEATIAGDLFDLPAGAVGWAAGLTHRRERGEFFNDFALQAGIDTLTPTRNVSGGYDTYEAYTEVSAPLVEAGEGFPIVDAIFQDLSFDGAIRYVDNNYAGSDTTWTAGFRGRLNLPLLGEDMLFRGNITEAIRSPTIPELFAPVSETFSFAADSCDWRNIGNGPNPTVRRANCEAEVAALKASGALPANFDLSTYQAIIGNASQPATTGGNPDLFNEKSKSHTYGFVYTPSFVPGLTISWDYTKIDLGDAIVQVTATQLSNACYDNVNYPNEACDRFERQAGTFQFQRPKLGYLNAANRLYKGWIGALSYNTAMEDIMFMDNVPGNLTITGSWNHINDHRQNLGDADLTIYSTARNNEANRYQFNFRYELDAFNVMWQWRHIGGGSVDPNRDSIETYYSVPTFHSSNFHNLSMGYQFTEQMSGRFTVTNLFDKTDSPILIAGRGGNGWNFRDTLGRRFTFGVTVDF